MTDLDLRIRMAAESILENEALRGGLDPAGQEVLMNWGVDWAQKIAAQSAHLNEVDAEEFLYPKMKALRKLLQAVSALGQQAPENEIELNKAVWEIRQLALEANDTFISSKTLSSAEINHLTTAETIRALRSLFEASSSPTN